jgi:transposase
MLFDIDHLPSDVNELQKTVLTLVHEHKILTEEKVKWIDERLLLKSDQERLLIENESLKEQLKLLRSKKFGQSSEKTKRQIEDLEEKIEENEVHLGLRLTTDSSIKSDSDDEKSKPKRLKFPPHLPREESVLPPDKTCKSCGGDQFRPLGEDVSEIIDYVPASFKVTRYIRPRCVCKTCEEIVQSPPPAKVIEKGKAGPGLLAHVIIQKYCSHMPLYRQSVMYGYEGIDLSRSTMAHWVAQCSKILDPLVEEIKKSILSSPHIHADDTPVKVLAPGLGKTKIGRLWCYVLDGRPHGTDVPPAACYFYSEDRKGIRPEEHLKDFQGVLHADAYAGYNKLYVSESNPNALIKEAGCWAHMRRKFYEITIASNNAKVAVEVIEQIRKIYKIEKDIRGSDPDHRLEVRSKESKSLVNELFDRFKAIKDKLPPKGSTAKAINYALNNEEALKLFLTDGKIEIGRVENWRAGLRFLVLTPLLSLWPSIQTTITAFPVPARQTGRALLTHPAFGQSHAFALGTSVRTFAIL